MNVRTAGGYQEMMYSLTAEDIMDCDCVIISQQLPIAEAARLLLEKRSSVAAVVDGQGRCTGLLHTADLLRWIDAGCPNEVVDPGLSCPHQVRGRLINGDEAVICTLAPGSCSWQGEQPTTGGRHSNICSQQEAAVLPFGAAPRYLTTEFVSILRHSPLIDMLQHIVDSQVDELIVLDDSLRPAGIVLATDIVIAVYDCLQELNQAGTGPTTGRKPK
jgi:CBS domain-containing protein